MSEQSVLGHIAELRKRLLYCVTAFVIATLLCYAVKEELYQFLVQPLAKAYDGTNNRLIYTNITEAFFTYLKTACYAGLFLAFPFISYQLWRFVAPGLYQQERHAFLPFLILSPVLFLLGTSLAYYIVLPLAWEFFLSFQQTGQGSDLAIELEAKVSEYFSLILQILLAFGLCFQIPVILTLMAKAGLIQSSTLREKRRYAIVISLVLAAFLTPPDIITQLFLALPLIILFELSILAIRVIEKNRHEPKEI